LQACSQLHAVVCACSGQAASDSVLTERTVLEVELKGVCESYDVVVEPSVLLIPGQILQDTVLRRKFKVTHWYTQSVLFIACVELCLNGWEKGKGKEEYLYSAILVRMHTLKALRHGSHSFTCKQHHACLSFVSVH